MDADEVTIQNNTFINNSGGGLDICVNGFLVRGNHAINNEDDGFEIESDRDDGTIVGNHAIANTFDGFNIGSSDSKNIKILRNRAFRNNSDGFDIEGDDLSIIGNRAETNEGDGFNLDDMDRAIVANNLARGNDEDGFEFDDTDDSTIRRNVALENGDAGFDFDGDANKLERNLAIGNEEDVLVLPTLVVKHLLGGLANRVADHGPTPRGAFGGEIGQEHADEGVVLGQWAFDRGIAGEGDDADPVALQSCQPVLDGNLGTFQTAGPDVFS